MRWSFADSKNSRRGSSSGNGGAMLGALDDDAGGAVASVIGRTSIHCKLQMPSFMPLRR